MLPLHYEHSLPPVASVLQCQATAPDAAKLSFGFIIILGLLLSYAPQLLKLWVEKDSTGISVIFLLVGFLGTASTLGNVVLLQSESIGCCLTVPVVNCLQDTFGVTQMLTQSTCFTLLEHHGIFSSVRLVICLYLAFVVVLVSLVLLVDQSTDYGDIKIWWAGVLGMISVLGGILQYLPQVYTTAVTKEFGALSLPTLMMQCPGSFAFVYSLSLQPGTNWTSWISFAICGSFQGILIAMYFAFKYSRLGYRPLATAEEDVVDGLDQPSPLSPPADHESRIEPAAETSVPRESIVSID
ncbi:hypothetical protein HDV03_001891 [Kappamyces sp. JEL0829]|nr:hypothetical protein HDV03_001891 [Kappamyces sp. JEL0829]